MDKSTHDEIRPIDEARDVKVKGSFWNFSDKNASEIQKEIRVTRADLDETVNALQARLDPHHLVNEAMEMVRDSLRMSAPRLVDRVRGSGPYVAETIRANPMPATLIAVGLGWLIFRGVQGPASRRSVSAYDEYGSSAEPGLGDRVGEGVDRAKGTLHSGAAQAQDWASEKSGQAKDWATGKTSQAKDWASDTAHQAKDWASQTTDKVKEAGSRMAGQIASTTKEKAGSLVDYTMGKAGEFAGATRDKAGDLADYTVEKAEDLARATLHGAQAVGHSTRVQLSRAGESTYQAIRENPWSFALACIGIGAAVALSLPQTRKERELMGEASDHLMERASEAGSETMEKLGNVIHASKEAAMEEARREELI